MMTVVMMLWRRCRIGSRCGKDLVVKFSGSASNGGAGFLGDVERPTQELAGVRKNSLLGAAEDDGYDFLAIGLAATDEAMFGLVGVAGFHAGAEPVVAHGLIGIAEHVKAAIGVAEVQILDGDDWRENRVVVGGAGNLGHVAGCGVLIVGGKSVRIHEMRGIHPKLTSLGIHHRGEVIKGTGVVATQGSGDIIGALYQEGGQKFAARVGGAGGKLKLGRFGGLVNWLDDDRFVEIAMFGYKQRGEELLGAADGAFLIGVAFKEDGSRIGINDDGGDALDLGRRRGGGN